MTGVATSEAAARLRLRVAGLVQGVGFRPYVHRLATELGLTGHVGNDTRGVFIEVEGTNEATEEFVRRLVTEAPGPSRIDEVLTRPMAPSGATGFTIVESRGHGTARTFVSPDIATCGDCLAELFDPADRRARYPFTNCTNCGPRFTITLSLPYDRPNTTMRGFALCEACASEYHDPADRRFHAQPIACADCGPRLWLEHSGRVGSGRGLGRGHRRRPGGARAGGDRRDQGSRRVPPGLRRTLRRRRAAAPGPEAPLREAVRRHGP